MPKMGAERILVSCGNGRKLDVSPEREEVKRKKELYLGRWAVGFWILLWVR